MGSCSSKAKVADVYDPEEGPVPASTFTSPRGKSVNVHKLHKHAKWTPKSSSSRMLYVPFINKLLKAAGDWLKRVCHPGLAKMIGLDNAWEDFSMWTCETLIQGENIPILKYYLQQKRYTARSSFRTWVQSHLLYAMCRNDATLTDLLPQIATDGLPFALRILSLFPFFGPIIFLLFFWASYRRDEFQLVNYITMCRQYQFITNGVVAFLVLAWMFYDCLDEIDSLQADTAGPQPVDLRTVCADKTPGSWPHASTAHVAVGLDFLRTLSVFYAYYLLLRGHACGGPITLNYYTAVRLDASDGKLDGKYDAEIASQVTEREASRRVGIGMAGWSTWIRRRVNSVDLGGTDTVVNGYAKFSRDPSMQLEGDSMEGTSTGGSSSDAERPAQLHGISSSRLYQELDRLLDQHQLKKFREGGGLDLTRRGGDGALTMRAFLWVDASCGLVLYALLVLWHGLLQKHTWMFMVSLFYANMLYSFTFAIYWLLVGPVWYIVTAGGSGAHRSCTLATGYDRSGFIGPMLDPRQRQQLREGLDGNEEGSSHLDAVQTLVQSFAGLLVSQPSLWYELVLLLHGKVSSAVDDMKRALEVSTQAARDAAAGVIGVFVRKKQKAKGRSEGPSYSHRSTDDALSSRREGEIRAR